MPVILIYWIRKLEIRSFVLDRSQKIFIEASALHSIGHKSGSVGFAPERGFRTLA